ncbi:MAG: hypothetical protein JWO61_398 [Candidatus Saccharibacteria bacterium]|nr:hypothetical protein [Candidatus Saccharibacteria bacterium]
MPRFPETDSPALGDIAVALSDPVLFESAHSHAENISSLYNLGHTGLKATLDSLILDPAVNAAIQTGIQAYEVLGSIVLSNDVHRQYTNEYIIRVVGDFSGSSNFILNFIDALEVACDSMTAETPFLSEAVAALVSQHLGDPSQELRYRGLEGAAIMRSIQLEIDELLAFEADLAQ